MPGDLSPSAVLVTSVSRLAWDSPRSALSAGKLACVLYTGVIFYVLCEPNLNLNLYPLLISKEANFRWKGGSFPLCLPLVAQAMALEGGCEDLSFFKKVLPFLIVITIHHCGRH